MVGGGGCQIAAVLAEDSDLMQVEQVALIAACGWNAMQNAGNEKCAEGVILEIGPS